MLAKDMCSQNQKVGHLICLIHNNVFWTQRIFRFLRNSLFRTNDLTVTFGERQSCRSITLKFSIAANLILMGKETSTLKVSFFIEMREEL